MSNIVYLRKIFKFKIYSLAPGWIRLALAYTYVYYSCKKIKAVSSDNQSRGHEGHKEDRVANKGPSIKYVTLLLMIFDPLSTVTNCHKSWTP